MLELVFGLLFDLVTTVTGYAVMFVFSLGRVRPRTEDDWLATLIGLAFWAILIGAFCLWPRE